MNKQELIDEIKGKYEKNILSGNYCYRWQYFEKALSELYDRLQPRKWEELTTTEQLNINFGAGESFYNFVLEMAHEQKPKRREIEIGRPCFFSNYAKEWQTINSYKCRDSSNLHLSKNMIDGRVVWKYCRPVPDGFQGDFDSIPLPTSEDM
jgi:hypothetical protein